MTDRSSRQIYLQLTACLYELAAKFSRSELRAARNVAAAENNTMTLAAIQTLLALHSDELRSEPQLVSDQKIKQSPDPMRNSESAERRRDRMLKEMLMSRELFLTPADIASGIPISMPLKPKESREKYVNRVVSRFRELDVAKRQLFMDSLQSAMSKTGSGSFVSRWSRLIKDL